MKKKRVDKQQEPEQLLLEPLQEQVHTLELGSSNPKEPEQPLLELGPEQE